MKLIDDVYEMYKDHLTGDEEDVLIIIYGVLDGFKNEDFAKLFHELSSEEKFEMTVLYLYEKLRLKLAQEGIGHIGNGDDQGTQILH
ncbi:cytosolic protein [Anaerobacillus sp. CMMVII]|uniref:DUF6154 family protein n=1 Tax=Anaerobacillus sp. CMMVII TaxID=2755588 RepID=UPI0021B785C5|nr:DUF6154 family protein [Anaerobacillus sp. CMMVII]MCT8137864.1 cytosolic protein [Anaerobacillus sp. CMMVII]